MLEVASELVDLPNWPFRQARVSLRAQGADDWPVTLFASDGPAAIEKVAHGSVQLAISNPAGFLAPAVRGTAALQDTNSAARRYGYFVAGPAGFCRRRNRHQVV